MRDVLQVLHAAKPAARLAAQRPHTAAGEKAMQRLGGERDCDFYSGIARGDLDRLDVGRRMRDAFGDGKADGEILKIARRAHHHRIGEAVIAQRQRRLLGHVAAAEVGAVGAAVQRMDRAPHRRFRCILRRHDCHSYPAEPPQPDARLEQTAALAHGFRAGASGLRFPAPMGTRSGPLDGGHGGGGVSAPQPAAWPQIQSFHLNHSNGSKAVTTIRASA